MAVYDQPITTYSDTTTHMRVISDVIFMIDPRDTALLDAIGGLDGARSKFKIRENGYKIEILEDELPPLTTSANNGTTISTNTTSFTVADASIFKDGDIILIDQELMVVSAADVVNNTISVYSRSYGGTNSTHGATATIEIVGQARLEGDDADFSAIVDITAPYNYTQIFQDALKVTGSMEKLSQYGIENEFEYQASKKIPHLLRLLDRNLFWGVRNAGSATTPRSFGGLDTFITDNVVTVGGTLSKAKIDDAMELIYADGGTPDILVVNPAVARDLKDSIDTSSFVMLDYQNTQLGMQPITRVVTQYGELRLVIDRFCPTSKAYVLDSRRVGVYTYRPFAWHELAVTGDSRKGEVIGEFSFLVANDKAHAKLINITT